MQYFGTQLSENISRREPEGYLLCLNVPVARSGTQEYLPEELGFTPGSFSLDSGTVPVNRPEEEVFSPETIASFQGMPVTNDHPPEGVDIENIRRLQMGHAQNVRRGSGAEADLLIADLMITDPRLIELILGGKREISCGYTYELAEENGQYVQRKIRGNHIAVVDAGRAGPRVAIHDRKADACNRRDFFGSNKNENSERRKIHMKKPIMKMLARMAKDGDIEKVAEFIEEMIGEEAGESNGRMPAEEIPTAEPAPEPVRVEVPENHPIIIDEETFGGIIERLDRLIMLLTAEHEEPADDEDPDKADEGSAKSGNLAEEIGEAVEEAVEAAQAEEASGEGSEEIFADVSEEVAEMVETILEPEVSTTLEEPEEAEEDEDSGKPGFVSVADAVHVFATAVQPVMKYVPAKQRKKVYRDLREGLRIPESHNGKDKIYSALSGKGRGKGAAGTLDDPRELGKRIMAARNPNYHG